MLSYHLELKASAQKELDKLPDATLERVIAKLEALQTDPRPYGCKKLKGGITNTASESVTIELSM